MPHPRRRNPSAVDEQDDHVAVERAIARRCGIGRRVIRARSTLRTDPHREPPVSGAEVSWGHCRPEEEQNARISATGPKPTSVVPARTGRVAERHGERCEAQEGHDEPNGQAGITRADLSMATSGSPRASRPRESTARRWAAAMNPSAIAEDQPECTPLPARKGRLPERSMRSGRRDPVHPARCECSGCGRHRLGRATIAARTDHRIRTKIERYPK